MKQIDIALLDELTRKARNSPRKRINFNLHEALNDPIQRLCNAIEPGTYIRPHRHAYPPTCEVFIMVRGSAVLLFFDDEGRVDERAILSAGGPVIAVEMPPKTWHSMAALESGTVFFEVKQGPYVKPEGPNVAQWSPAEGEAGTADIAARYQTVRTGERLLPI